MRVKCMSRYRQLSLPIECHLSPTFFLLFSLRIVVSSPVTMFPSRRHRWTGPQPLTSWRPPVTPAFLLLPLHRSKNPRHIDVDPSVLFDEQQDACWESSPGSCTYRSERQCQMLHTSSRSHRYRYRYHIAKDQSNAKQHTCTYIDIRSTTQLVIIFHVAHRNIELLSVACTVE